MNIIIEPATKHVQPSFVFYFLISVWRVTFWCTLLNKGLC